jgi:hypothetical protein
MGRCSACGHDDIVHYMFAGCCLVVGCPCLGADGLGPNCTPEAHAGHGSFTPRPAPTTHLEYVERLNGRTVTVDERAVILAMKADGHGKRTIGRTLKMSPTLVSAVIREVHGAGPAAQPRTRPRAEHRQAALDAGITPEEFTAERRLGGRAATITALEQWVAERAS